MGWDDTRLGIWDLYKAAFSWGWADSPCASSSVGIKAWDHTAPGAIPPPWMGSRCPWRWRERNQPWITEESLLEHQELWAQLPRESHTPPATHPGHCQGSSSLVGVDGGFLEFLARAPSSRVPNAAPSSTEPLLKSLLAGAAEFNQPFHHLLPGTSAGEGSGPASL